VHRKFRAVAITVASERPAMENVPLIGIARAAVGAHNININATALNIVWRDSFM